MGVRPYAGAGRQCSDFSCDASTNTVTAFMSFSSGNGNAVEEPLEVTPEPRDDGAAVLRCRADAGPLDRVEETSTGNGNAVEDPLEMTPDPREEVAEPREVTSDGANDLLDAALPGGVGGQLFTASRSRTSAGSNPHGMGDGEGDGEWRRWRMAPTRWVRGRGLPCGLAYGLPCGLEYGLV